MRRALALSALLPVLTACGAGGQHVTAAAAVSTPTNSSANAVSAPAGAEAPTDAKGRPAPGTQAFCKAALRDVNNATALRRLTGREPKSSVDWGIWSDADSLASDYENAGMFAGDTKGLQENLAADTMALHTDCAAN